MPLSSQGKEEVEKYQGYTSDKGVPVVVSAMNGNVDLLVTGNKKDLSKLRKSSHLKIKTLNPSKVLNVFRDLFEDFQHKWLDCLDPVLLY